MTGQGAGANVSPTAPPPPRARLPGLTAVVNRKWVVKPRPVADPTLRVICFPHVGAGASVFNDWADQLPSGAELCAIRFPGRENRLDEPLLVDLPRLLSRLGTVLAPLFDRPFVLFGHCSGSIIAFALARWLRAKGRPQPALLVVSSIEAPAVQTGEPPLHRLPREELFARVARFGGMPPEVLGDPEMMEMFEAILRADTQLVESAQYVDEPGLDVSLAVVGGRYDRIVRFESMAAWRWETTKHFSLHLLPIGHFVLDEAAELVGSLVRDLERGIRADGNHAHG
jgi:surfactin synthase thioesterase subunit